MTTASIAKGTTLPIRNSDVWLALGVLGLIAVLLIPLPPFMLDVLIAFSLAVSFLILFAVLATKEPRELSTFPSLLLFTTLLRLALNVASTRSILSQGHAGQVIQAFGGFVVGGNMLIGVVVFLILVVIQFVVITKGAGRISEVAARFTLDAMPGKQMAIDADLNAGVINMEEARARREAVAREAEFYGAMDGASKFVRGDAVAALVITLVSIVGGIIIGLLRGMSAMQALTTYAVLTIGDGLVSQIPALMISTAGGILVTKSSSTAQLSDEMTGQIATKPRAIGIAAAVVGAIGLMPGLPLLPFALLGSALFALRRLTATHKRKTAAPAEAGAVTPENEKEREQREIMDLLKVDRLGIEIGYRLIPLVDRPGGNLLDHIAMARKRFAAEMGVVIPPVRVKDNLAIDPSAYRVLLAQQVIGSGELRPGYLLAMDPGTAQGKIDGVATTEPTFGLPALWIREDARTQAEDSGYTVIEPVAVMVTHVTELLRAHAHEILNRDDVKSLVDGLKERHPAVVEELIPGHLSLGDVQRVLKKLLKDRIPIRDLGAILETLADHAPQTKEVDALTELCRQRLARAIVARHENAAGVLHVVTLDPQLERTLADYAAGTVTQDRPMVMKRVVAAIAEAVRKAAEKGVEPVVVCKSEVRRMLAEVVQASLPRIAVLSYHEAAAARKLESLAVASGAPDRGNAGCRKRPRWMRGTHGQAVLVHQAPACRRAAARWSGSGSSVAPRRQASPAGDVAARLQAMAVLRGLTDAITAAWVHRGRDAFVATLLPSYDHATARRCAR
ncbi:MAG: flagellar biosynthesis protein FlhA [Planctomycetota bacterium]